MSFFKSLITMCAFALVGAETNYVSPVMESAFHFLKTFNDTDTRKMFNQKMQNISFHTDTSDIDCVDYSQIHNFVQDVLPYSAITTKMVDNWSNIQEHDSFMMYLQENETHVYFSLKRDAPNTCYDFMVSKIVFTPFVNNTNCSSSWCHPDDYHYVDVVPSMKNLTEMERNIVYYITFEALENTESYHYLAGKLLNKKILGETGKFYNRLPSDENDAFDLVRDGLQEMKKILDFNISQLGSISNMTGKVVSVNTCLGFDYFDVQVQTAAMTGIPKDSVPDFVNQVFAEALGCAENSTEAQQDIAELKYPANVTWVMSHLDFSSANMTRPGYAKIWKQTDPNDSTVSNWLVSYVYGQAKIAEDIYAKVTQHEFAWGLWSSTSVDIFYEPHKVTPADMLALQAFFRSVLQNGECDALETNATITYFPKIDC